MPDLSFVQWLWAVAGPLGVVLAYFLWRDYRFNVALLEKLSAILEYIRDHIDPPKGGNLSAGAE